MLYCRPRAEEVVVVVVVNVEEEEEGCLDEPVAALLVLAELVVVCVDMEYGECAIESVSTTMLWNCHLFGAPGTLEWADAGSSVRTLRMPLSDMTQSQNMLDALYRKRGRTVEAWRRRRCKHAGGSNRSTHTKGGVLVDTVDRTTDSKQRRR
jgi:hypothetical protein